MRERCNGRIWIFNNSSPCRNSCFAIFVQWIKVEWILRSVSQSLLKINFRIGGIKIENLYRGTWKNTHNICDWAFMFYDPLF